MLNLQDIESYFPEYLREFKRNILREYLQYKILKILFETDMVSKLSFIGGTSLRIVYNLSRFSEDLDFDNFGLKEKEFNNASVVIKKELELEGLDIEILNFVNNTTFHCEIKFPTLLFNNDLSVHKNEKILVKVDTQSHDFKYKPDVKLLNKFDVFTNVNVTPLDILLSMKFNALFKRKRIQGRDFYDIVFLLGKTSPNYDYLKQKLGIKNSKDLKEKILHKCKELNFKKISEDLEPLVFASKDLNKVLLFSQCIEQSEL